MQTLSGQEEDQICRFCYESYTSPDNSLISPCKCIGSIQYVHQQCIKRWRLATENPEAVLKCQLCLTYLIIPSRYELELIPNIEMNNAWYFLSKPIIFIVLLYSIFLSLINSYHMVDEDSSLFPHSNTIVLYKTTTLANIYHVAHLFMLCLFVITSMYIAFYRYILQTLKNVDMYFHYWRCYRVGDVYPMPFLCLVTISYTTIYIYVMDIHNIMRYFIYVNRYITITSYNAFHFILGELSIITYLTLLPKFIPIHMEILRVMNAGAEY
jgi:hypothetical protein